MSSPDPRLPEVPLWARFTADPRQRPEMRAGDADREVVLTVLNDAYGEGRLTSSEHDERLHLALEARTLGDLSPLVADIVATPAPKPPPTPVRRVRDGAIRSWLGLAILFNVIWLATWLFSGDGPYYYWPIWPMIGTAIPAVIPFFFPDRGRRDDEPPALNR